jgi:hypothetical protein
VVRSIVLLWVKSGVLRVSAGVFLYILLISKQSWKGYIFRTGPRTFGMAYTKEPSGDEVADSPEDDVRKSSRFGPLLVS